MRHPLIQLFHLSSLLQVPNNCRMVDLEFLRKFSCSCERISLMILSIQFSIVQLLSRVWLFVTPWTAAWQASLSNTSSQSLLKLMSVELVMLSNHLILYHPLLLLPSIFPSIRVFSNESVLHIKWPSIGASALPSLLSVNIQDWFPLRWTGWIP